MAAVIINWNAVADGSITSVLTTELNSLATATDSSAGSAFDNRPSGSSLGFKKGFAQASLTFPTNPTAGSAAYLYAVRAIDGTNYGTVNSASAKLVAVFPLRATTSAQVIDADIDNVPPTLLKFFAKTDAGQTLAASGNTIKIKFADDQAQ